MTCSYLSDRNRIVFISSGGNDLLTGFSESYPVTTLSQANTNAVNETPTLEDPVLIRGLDGARYLESSGISFGDFVRVNCEDSSITGFCSLPTTGYVRLASVVTIPGVNGVSAVSADSKDQTSLVAFGVFTNGESCVGYDISGTSSDVFCDIGQIAVNGDNSIAISYTSSGTPRRLQVNEINLGNIFTGSSPTGCTGIYYNTSNTSAALVVDSSALTQNGTGNKGIEVVNGKLVALIPDIRMGTDLAIDVKVGGVLTFTGSVMKGNIENLGEAQIQCQIIDGNIDSSGAAITQVKSQEINGDITHSSPNGRYEAQSYTGDIAHVSGGAVYRMDSHVGSTVVTSGVVGMNVEALFGSVTLNGGATYADIKSISGNLTVAAGARLVGEIYELSGSFIPDPAASLSCQVNGVNYGTWAEGSDYLATFSRIANTPNNWDNIGYLQIDTTTDTPNAFTVGYRQNSGGNRTHKVRIIDADTSTVYYEDSNNQTGSANYFYDALTVVNALPTNQVVNLAFEHERDGGPGLADTSIAFEFTRA